MKSIFKVSLFTLGLVLSSNSFAATGTGHAQAELSTPLSVANQTTVNFGTIAIDPAAGVQVISISPSSGEVTCPATYVCSGSPGFGRISVTGAPNATVDLDVTGQVAVLDDGLGNTLTFDPYFFGESETRSSISLGAGGFVNNTVGGTISFTGSEIAGTYTSQNGTGYQVTVNY